MSFEELCHRWLGALFNGLWQGLLLTGLAALGLRCVPRVNAATRHAVWFAVLLWVALLPLFHFLFDRSRPGLAGESPLSLVTPVAGEDGARLRGETVNPDPDRRETFEAPPTAPPRLSGNLGPIPGKVEAFAMEGWRGSASRAVDGPPRSFGRPDSRPPVTRADQGGVPPEELPWGPILASLRGQWSDWISADRHFQLPTGMAVLLTAGWLSVVLLRLTRLARECLQLSRLKQGSQPASVELQSTFAALGAEMGLRRKARLLIGRPNGVPLAAGLWQPAVLLPKGLSESASDVQVQQVLRHELGHLIRWDDWGCLIQQILQSFLFFHPAAWWLSHRLTLEREIACDDHVLAALPSPQAYALFLTDFAGRVRSREIAAAPAAWNRKTQLKERITMILDSKRNASPRLARLSAGLFITATALLSGWVVQAAPRVALAAARAETAIANDSGEAAVSPDAITLSAPSKSSGATKATTKSAVVPTVATVVAVPEVPLPPTVATVVAVPHPHPQPRLNVAVPVAPIFAVNPPAAPPPPAQPVPPRGPYALNSEGGEASGRRSLPPKPDGLTVEQRLERLERMLEELLSRPQALLPDGPALQKLNESARAITRNINRDEIAKLSTEAKKMAKEAGERLKGDAERLKGELQRRIQEQVRDPKPRTETAVREMEHLARMAEREAERAVRDAERIARDAERSAAAAVAAANETLRSKTPDRQRLQSQRQTLQAQQKSLEKRMEEIERQLERLEEAQEELQDQDSYRQDQTEDGPKKKEVF